MTRTTVVDLATHLPEIIRCELADFAYGRGGCTSRCRLAVDARYDLDAAAHLIEVMHNARERRSFGLKKLHAQPADRFELYEQIEPWLRGLHRFPVESGIK